MICAGEAEWTSKPVNFICVLRWSVSLQRLLGYSRLLSTAKRAVTLLSLGRRYLPKAAMAGMGSRKMAGIFCIWRSRK